jgi:hypothetical protein
VGSFLFASLPLTTDDAGTVEHSKYELEVCYDRCKIQSDISEHSFGLSFKHGLTEKMDLGICFPFLIEPKPKESFGPMSIGLKFSLIEELLAFSLSNQLGSSEYFLNGIFSYQVSPVMLHLNLGYRATGIEDVEGSISYGFALEYPVKKFDIVCESLGDKDDFQDYSIGLRYNLKDGVAISTAYSNGFNESRERIIAGFHYEF